VASSGLLLLMWIPIEEVLFMKHTKAVYDNKGVKRDKTYQREKKETATQNCEFPIYFRSEI
jgi:hypothetical protein